MSRNFIEDDVAREVRLRTDIVALISEYVKLRKTGKNYVGLCPFHEEKTGSFTVDPDKQLFYCFGCGTGGNAFTFLMKREGLTFPEALEKLAQRAGVRLEPRRRSAAQEARKKEYGRLLDALEFAQARFREMLYASRGRDALSYLEKRGLSRETIDKFGLGYAPNEWDFIATGARRSGFNQADFAKAGLLLERSGGGYYDRFRNRVTFPIWDGGGTLIGFGGRALGDENPKYLNSPETPVFRKGRELYALNLAKPGIRRADKVCVMEGYMDVITSYQHGIDYTVAGMGTALSREQARALLLLTEHVYLVYDQDEAGKRATRRSIEVFRDAGGRTQIVSLPGAKDPDVFLRTEGSAAFEGLLTEALPDMEFIYDEARRENAHLGMEGKIRVRDAMVPVLASLSSDFELSAYIEEFSRDLAVPRESLAKDVEAYRRKAEQARKYKQSQNRDTTGYDNQRQPIPGRGSKEVETPAGIKPSDIEISVVRRKAEEGVIRCLIENRGLLARTMEILGDEDFADPICRELFRVLQEGSLDTVADERIQTHVAELCLRFGEVPKDSIERILNDCVRRLRRERLEELRETIALAERTKDQAMLVKASLDYQRLLKQLKSTGDASDGSAL
jgi:DNA primase